MNKSLKIVLIELSNRSKFLKEVLLRLFVAKINLKAR